MKRRCPKCNEELDTVSSDGFAWYTCIYCNIDYNIKDGKLVELNSSKDIKHKEK